MDKLVLSLLLSLLAGFLTAVGTFVKLVNDKESKVTEFRQQWTDTARQSLADLLSQLRYYCNLTAELTALESEASSIVRRPSDPEKLNEFDSALLQNVLESQSKNREALKQALRNNREAIHNAYAFAKLHFKPNDPDFLHVETKVDQALQLIDGNLPGGNSGQTLRAELMLLINDLTTLSRGLLKKEWENIKGGERAYRLTRIWAKRGGLAGAGALTVLLGCFGVAALLNWKETSDIAMLAKLGTSKSGEPAAHSAQNYSVPVAAPQVTNACAEIPPPGVTVVQQIATNGEGRMESSTTPTTPTTAPVTSRPKTRVKAPACEIAGTTQ
ncbi:hypothetical protein BTH42_09115 [Burkholderia sp. SRS-W-2-2016]|uniref:hypothetical protein n=1 Tax=Burkholderia sp. SRS-W-2-2016 TaxID=1926878 RepID=UPI00094B045B|nr:hypothetical protein [Burkholderia sp. SRS-W-2-2016]OLL31793.1 hypothetical protein BTH42_09115 [Burkholderia sp. SRS-W-2-2016]